MRTLILIAFLGAFISCDEKKKLEDVHKHTLKMSKEVEETKKTADNADFKIEFITLSQRRALAAQLRAESFKNLITLKENFQLKTIHSSAYIYALEFQNWINLHDDVKSFNERNKLMGEGAEDLLQKFQGLLKDLDKDSLQTCLLRKPKQSLTDEENHVLALYALAAVISGIDKVQYDLQEINKKREKTLYPIVAASDIILFSLKNNYQFKTMDLIQNETGPVARDTYYENRHEALAELLIDNTFVNYKVDLYESTAIELLKIRHDVLLALAVNKIFDVKTTEQSWYGGLFGWWHRCDLPTEVKFALNKRNAGEQFEAKRYLDEVFRLRLTLDRMNVGHEVERSIKNYIYDQIEDSSIEGLDESSLRVFLLFKSLFI